MAMTIIVNDTDRSSLLLDIPTAKDQKYGADIIEFKIGNADRAYDNTFKRGDDIEFSVASELRFVGSIVDVNHDHDAGVIGITGREKIGEFTQVPPLESEYFNKLRSFVLIDLVEKYGRSVNTYHVNDSPTGSEITTKFRGGKTLFEVLDDFALEDGYRYIIQRTKDSGSVEVDNGAITLVSGNTQFGYADFSNTYDVDEIKNGKIKFTSGTLNGNTYDIMTNTALTLDIRGDVTSDVSDEDTFSIKVDSLTYEEEQTVVSPLTIDTVNGESYGVQYPETGQDIINQVYVYGDQEQKGNILNITYAAPITTVTVTDSANTYHDNDFIDGLFTFTDPNSGKALGSYQIVGNSDDATNDTFDIKGDALTDGFTTSNTYKLPIQWPDNDTLSQIYKGNPANDPDLNNPYINATQIIDKSIKSPLQASRRSSRFLLEHAWKLDIFSVRLWADSYKTLRPGELIESTIDTYATAQKFLVVEMNWIYRSNQVDVLLTYYRRDLDRVIVDLVKKMHAIDANLIEDTDITVKSLNIITPIEIPEEITAHKRQISSNAFVVGRDIIGDHAGTVALIGDQSGSGPWIEIT